MLELKKKMMATYVFPEPIEVSCTRGSETWFCTQLIMKLIVYESVILKDHLGYHLLLD